MMNYKDVVEFEALIEALTDIARAHGVNEQDFVFTLIEWFEQSAPDEISYIDIIAAAADIWTAQERDGLR
jgi:hypothetical protein